MDYLNLGCGKRYHPEWTNIDFKSKDTAVISHNLAEDIPFSPESFSVIYHSHLLEHFTKIQAKQFLLECYRVLTPHGIIRVVVPDLEQIICCYSKNLHDAECGDQEASYNYNWILLELFDQIARNSSGGEMRNYLQANNISNVEFVLNRIGLEGKQIIDEAEENRKKIALNSDKFIQTIRKIARFVRDIGYGRDFLFRFLLGSKDFQALQTGRFRQSGEIHQWMYDRYSLRILLMECGFTEVKQCAAHESKIPNWSSFCLDTEPDGTIYKPDSLFMEAIKPD